METKTWIPAVTFGTRLTMVRHQLGWNQGEAAARCGVNDASWSAWERGALPRNMAQVVEKVHQATGVDRAWLMWGEGSGEGGTMTRATGVALSWPGRLVSLPLAQSRHALAA